MEEARALMDSLMGGDRNLGKKDERKRINWYDDNMCHKFLAWECPCDFFLNNRGIAASRSPLGDCGKEHVDAMKTRFEEDKDYNKYRRRYLVELERYMKHHLDSINSKIERDKATMLKGESFTKDAQASTLTEISTRSILIKDKMLAAEEMAASGEIDSAQNVIHETMLLAHEQGRLERLKEKTECWIDEICEVCCAYMSWREPEEMAKRKRGEPHAHLCGILHKGWQSMRDSHAKLLEEIKNLPPADPSESTDRKDGHEDVKHKGEDGDAGGDRKRRRADEVDDRRRREPERRDDDRRNRDRDGRDRDNRGRDDGRNRDRDDRDRRDREKDGDRARRSDRQDKDPKKVTRDEFGRVVGESREEVAKREKEAAEVREKQRSRSRDGSRSRGRGSSSAQKKGGAPAPPASEEAKVVEVDYSENWEQVMEMKFAKLGLQQDAWDMTAADRRGKVIKLDAEVVEINQDSFPLSFRFERKPPPPPDSEESDDDADKIVEVDFSENWEQVMEMKFGKLGLQQEAWDMTCKDRRGKTIKLDAEVVEINEGSFPLQFKFVKKV